MNSELKAKNPIKIKSVETVTMHLGMNGKTTYWSHLRKSKTATLYCPTNLDSGLN